MGLEGSQLFPEIFEIVLRPFWWAAGSEQPSPPLHRAAAARLLRRSCVLQQYFSPPHIICISQCFANHISDGRRVWLTELVMHSGCASTQLLLIITAAAHISCLYLSKWWIVFPNLTWSYLWWGNFAPPSSKSDPNLNCFSEHNLTIFMIGQFCSSVLGLTGTSSLSKGQYPVPWTLGPLCLWQCFVSESVGEPDYSIPHLTL